MKDPPICLCDMREELLGFATGKTCRFKNGNFPFFAVITNSVKNYIRVEGSTDNVPISNGNLIPIGSLLLSVLSTLLNADYLWRRPSRISATSYGEYRHVVPNDSTEIKKLNRRVDIVFVNIQYNVNEPGYEEKK